jgi:hypothetical protein
MFAAQRIRLTIAGVAAAFVAAAGVGMGLAASASASPVRPAVSVKTTAPAHHPAPISVARLDLSGFTVNAQYTLGRNTGNTFQQVYGSGTVQGTPIAGPYVGTTFPAEDYVALRISADQVYITWLDPATDAIVDVFVMNLRTHTVYDYAPGSASTESAGHITVVHLPRALR